jgi:hypothetical protein
MLWHKAQGAGGTVGGGGGGAIEFIDYLGFDADAAVGQATVTFPAGTQDGDLVILLAVSDSSFTYSTPPSPFTEIWSYDNDDQAVSVYSQMSYGFYNSATWPSSVIVVGTPLNSGAGVAVYRNVSTITSQTPNGQLRTADDPPVPFNSSTLSSDGRVLCAVMPDDDVPTAASQTGYTVDVVDFVGAGAGSGCGIILTLSNSTISSGSYTPPDVSITGISGDPSSSMYLLLT